MVLLCTIAVVSTCFTKFTAVVLNFSMFKMLDNVLPEGTKFSMRRIPRSMFFKKFGEHLYTAVFVFSNTVPI
eukprot:SAG31_NODE_34_length_31842_cov_31.677850_26_plen_72_part_00